jgi:hypothetical protein
MPLRFQRRIRIAPGISLNLNKNSVSTSFGQRGAHITVGPKGKRSTIGLPGTGLSYTSYKRGKPGIFLAVVIVIVIGLAILLRYRGVRARFCFYMQGSGRRAGCDQNGVRT